MEIILKKDVDRLGSQHDIVTVKSGFARNFLIPQGHGSCCHTFGEKSSC